MTSLQIRPADGPSEARRGSRPERALRPAPSPWWTILTVTLTGVAITAYILTRVTRVNPVDFLVYRYGANAALDGLPLFAGDLFGPMMPAGGMPFTYTPFAAIALGPTTLFDSGTAYVLWSLLCTAALAAVLLRFIPADLRFRPLIAPLVLIVASATTVVTEHLSYGQINLLLMALVIGDVCRSDSSVLGRVLPRGLLVGIAAGIKLTPALFIVYFVVTRQWRLALWSAIGAAGTVVVSWIVLPALTVQFWTDRVWTLSSKVDLSGNGFASYGNGSIQGIAAFLGLPGIIGSALALAVAAAALLLAARTYRRGAWLDAVLIIGLAAPIVSPVSWIHHWVYILPALVAVIFRRPGIRALLLIAAMLPFLIIGPGLGDLIMTDLPWLRPIGFSLREILPVASVVAALLVTRHPPTAGSADLAPVLRSERTSS